MRAISPRLNGRLIVHEQVEEDKDEIVVESRKVSNIRKSNSCLALDLQEADLNDLKQAKDKKIRTEPVP